MRDDVKVLDVLYLLIQGGELMEMRGEQAECMNLRGDVPVRQLVVSVSEFPDWEQRLL